MTNFIWHGKKDNVKDILQLPQGMTQAECDVRRKRYLRLKERLKSWPLDTIIEVAALIGAQYGYEWADQFEVAEGIIECNSLGIAEKVADELEDSIPEPRNDTAERAATILAFIKKREADPNYKPTVEEAKLIRPLEPKEKP